jgi:hypothetical protein
VRHSTTGQAVTSSDLGHDNVDLHLVLYIILGFSKPSQCVYCHSQSLPFFCELGVRLFHSLRMKPARGFPFEVIRLSLSIFFTTSTDGFEYTRVLPSWPHITRLVWRCSRAHSFQSHPCRFDHLILMLLLARRMFCSTTSDQTSDSAPNPGPAASKKQTPKNQSASSDVLGLDRTHRHSLSIGWVLFDELSLFYASCGTTDSWDRFDFHTFDFASLFLFRSQTGLRLKFSTSLNHMQRAFIPRCYFLLVVMVPLDQLAVNLILVIR